MSQDRNTTDIADEARSPLERSAGAVPHTPGPVGKIEIKCGGDAGHVPLFQHDLRNVRAADCCRSCIILHFVVRQIKTEITQSLDELQIPALPAGQVTGQCGLQSGISRIDKVPKNMQFCVLVRAADLDARNDPDPELLPGGHRFRQCIN